MLCVISFVAFATNQPLFCFVLFFVLFFSEQPLHFVYFVLPVLHVPNKYYKTEVISPVNSITYLAISRL